MCVSVCVYMGGSVLQCVAVCCNIHCNTHCNTLQHTATHCNTLCNTHCNTHCSTHCNTHCNTLTAGGEQSAVEGSALSHGAQSAGLSCPISLPRPREFVSVYCGRELIHQSLGGPWGPHDRSVFTATHCNTLRQTEIHYNSLQST